MKITIFTLGTRGDIQPFAVLGQALARRGHHVTLSTARNFKELVLSHGIHFHPVDADYEEILNSEEGRKILQVNLFAIQRNLNKLIYPLIQRSLTEFYSLAKSSDLIIYRPKTFVDVFVDELPGKAIRAAVIPAVEETAAFLNPMYSALRLPGFFNKISYKLNNLKYQFFRKPLGRFCSQHGLPESRKNSSSVPFIYGLSPNFLDKPNDWPMEHQLTGFWFSEEQNKLPQDLSDFLEAGDPPLLITFGSMPIKKETTVQLLAWIKKIQQRVILVRGWADWDTRELEQDDNFKIIRSAPFDALFPKVRAVIHHGGIGTTAECLRAGKPMFICPILYPVGDQFFWGDLAYKKGLAVKPVPISRLTASLFGQRIEQLLASEDLYVKSKQMAKRINAENGTRRAVDIIEEIAGL